MCQFTTGIMGYCSCFSSQRVGMTAFHTQNCVCIGIGAHFPGGSKIKIIISALLCEIAQGANPANKSSAVVVAYAVGIVIVTVINGTRVITGNTAPAPTAGTCINIDGRYRCVAVGDSSAVSQTYNAACISVLRTSAGQGCCTGNITIFN